MMNVDRVNGSVRGLILQVLMGNRNLLATSCLTLRDTDIFICVYVNLNSYFCYAGESGFMEMVIWAGATPRINQC
jgi:hypothetical protein